MNTPKKEEKIDLKSLKGFLIGTRSSLTFRRVLQQDDSDIVEQGRFISLVSREQNLTLDFKFRQCQDAVEFIVAISQALKVIDNDSAPNFIGITDQAFLKKR